MQDVDKLMTARLAVLSRATSVCRMNSGHKLLFVTHCKCQTVVLQGSEDLANTLVCASSHRCFTRTVEVTICIILERLLDRPRQLPHVKSHSSPSRPKAAQGTTKTDYGRADVWQPKSLHNSIWQGKPVCWGRPGVQPRLPGSP